ncbi:MAG: hypothetical protein ACLSAH_02215 [Bilophila wadsworthia]
MVEDGKDLSQTPDVTEGLIFEGQLHAKWDGEGHTGTPPDRVFGIEEKDEFGLGTGKQIQSSAADGFVTAEGKYGYLIIDPVTGKIRTPCTTAKTASRARCKTLPKDRWSRMSSPSCSTVRRRTPPSPSTSTAPTTHRSSTATRI